MARAKTTKRSVAKKQSEPTPEPKKETPTAESPTPEPTSSISKAEAVRQAVAQGLDDISDIVSFVKAKFAIEMPRSQIRTYKAQAKKRSGTTSLRPKRGRPPKSTNQPRATNSSEGDLLDALEKMKPLVAALGVEKVKRLAELLG